MWRTPERVYKSYPIIRPDDGHKPKLTFMRAGCWDLVGVLKELGLVYLVVQRLGFLGECGVGLSQHEDIHNRIQRLYACVAGHVDAARPLLEAGTSPVVPDSGFTARRHKRIWTMHDYEMDDDYEEPPWQGGKVEPPEISNNDLLANMKRHAEQAGNQKCDRVIRKSEEVINALAEVEPMWTCKGAPASEILKKH